MYKGRLLSVVLDHEIESTAMIADVLPGSGLISGRFTPEYVLSVIALLRSGPLPARLSILSEERRAANPD